MCVCVCVWGACLQEKKQKNSDRTYKKQLCEVLVLFTFINIFFSVFFLFVSGIRLYMYMCVCVKSMRSSLWGIVASPLCRMRNILFCNYMRGKQTKICV